AGNRVSFTKDVGNDNTTDGTANYAYDANDRLLTETDTVAGGTNTTTNCVYAETTFTPGGPAAGTMRMLGYDGHGSTRFLTDLTAAVDQVFAYDAYGNALGFDPASAHTNRLYSGQQWDPRIGLQ